MLCPRDNVVCNPLQLKDIEIAVCRRCQGVWIEQSAMLSLVRLIGNTKPADLEELLPYWQEIDTDGQTLPKDFWREDTLVCPFDNNKLKKHYFAGTFIGIDHCLCCYRYWIDGAEVKAIADYVKYDPVKDALAHGYAKLAAEPINRAFRESGPKSKEDLFYDVLLNILALLLLGR